MSIRDTVRFDGIGRTSVTLEAHTSLGTYDASIPRGTPYAGRAIALDDDGLARLAADGAAVYGLLLHMESDRKVVVQRTGFAPFPVGTGPALDPGMAIAGAASGGQNGYVRPAVIGDEMGRGYVVRVEDGVAWVDLG